MLCPPITSSSESQLPMKVDEEEHKDNVEEEERFKALSCVDRVRMLFWDLNLWSVFTHVINKHVFKAKQKKAFA